jgi:hypothetical protein
MRCEESYGAVSCEESYGAVRCEESYGAVRCEKSYATGEAKTVKFRDRNVLRKG